MRKPNFFIVGAAKSATTSMNYYLAQHPDIFMCPVVDTWHFISDMTTSASYNIKDRDEYERLFAGAGNENIIGEKSVFYLFSPAAPRNIYDYNAESRILVILRHPVEVMFSLHRQFLSTGNDDIYDFVETLAAQTDRRRGSRIPRGAHFADALQYQQVVQFSNQVNRYFEIFGRDRVKVILYDDIKRELAESYRDVLRFLGVNDAFEPNFAAKNVTAEKTIRNLNIRRLLKRNRYAQSLVRYLPRRFRGVIGDGLSRVNRRHAIESDRQLSSALRRRLVKEMESEVRALEKVIDRDLSHWTSSSAD